ncbi:hypothetical protein CTAYLR_009375 [Chrysophaeum taylorii]|uniref:EF-hand domain-containing protein n=1 Tax=Chrysophaeum taylorii TaxID=2483200 RepID=A0AAD7XIU4_9STRA|nr:hypothetical protein CTAYLR_009375 [Chrysophaeum taylorii]
MRDRDMQEVLDRLGEIVEKKYSWRGMQEAFEEFDTDFSGEIDAEEMHEGLRKFGITLSVAEAERVLARFPGDGRRVRYRDFVAAMSGRPPPFYAGARTATYAIRRLAQEVERCSRTKTGYDVRKVFEDLDGKPRPSRNPRRPRAHRSFPNPLRTHWRHGLFWR